MEKTQTKTVILGFNSCQMDEMFYSYNDAGEGGRVKIKLVYGSEDPSLLVKTSQKKFPPLLQRLPSDYVSKNIKLSESCCPEHQWGGDLCQLQRTLLFQTTM